MSHLFYCLDPIATYNTQGNSSLSCDWAYSTCTECYICKVCILEVLNWLFSCAMNELYREWTVQYFPEQLGLLLVNLIMYRSVCSLKSADLCHWSGSRNLLLAILFTKRFLYLSKKLVVDWTLELIILVECKQLAFADWALLLYYTYSPILVLFF